MQHFFAYETKSCKFRKHGWATKIRRTKGKNKKILKWREDGWGGLMDNISE